jgi:hypothetical protein
MIFFNNYNLLCGFSRNHWGISSDAMKNLSQIPDESREISQQSPGSFLKDFLGILLGRVD